MPRHSFASLLARSGVPAAEAAAWGVDDFDRIEALHPEPTAEDHCRGVAIMHPELAEGIAKIPAGYIPTLARVLHFDGVDEATMTIKKRPGAVYISSIAPYPTEG